MEELNKLKKKIIKDKEQSEFRMSQIQREIQGIVKERKERREEWEEYDRLAEGNLTELVEELSAIQGRMLAGQDLLDFLDNK